MTIYAAAKAAVNSLAKGLSLDLLSRRIRVNTLSPGPIDTLYLGRLFPREHVAGLKQMWMDITGRKNGLIGRYGESRSFLAYQSIG